MVKLHDDHKWGEADSVVGFEHSDAHTTACLGRPTQGKQVQRMTEVGDVHESVGDRFSA